MEGVKRQCGCPQRHFSAFSRAVFANFRDEAGSVGLYTNTQLVVSFAFTDPKMHELQRPLVLRVVFAPVWLAPTVREN